MLSRRQAVQMDQLVSEPVPHPKYQYTLFQCRNERSCRRSYCVNAPRSETYNASCCRRILLVCRNKFYCRLFHQNTLHIENGTRRVSRRTSY